MKTLKCFLLIIILFFVSQLSFSQTVDEIIQKHSEALGGIENLKAIKSQKIIGSMSMTGMEFPFTSYTLSPDKNLTEVSVQGMTLKDAYDGSIGWTINPMAGATKPKKVDEETASEYKKRGKIISPLITYKEDGTKVELKGNEKVNNIDVFKIIYTDLNEGVVNYYIDVNTYLLVKSEKNIKINGKSYFAESYYSNYKKIGDVFMAYMIEIETKDSPMGKQTLIIDKIELNPTIDEKIFSMPE